MSTSISEKALVPGLHDLLTNIDPSLKSTINNVEVAEDVLLHLEETDETFHKHDFVKFLHESIGDKIGPVIDEEIEKRSESTDINSISRQESLVQAVTQSVVESNEFSSLTKQMNVATISAAEELLRKIEYEKNASSDDDTESQMSKHLRSVCSEGESSYGSSFNQGYYFMTHEQFHCIADEMDQKQPTETRREALLRLCQVPPSDVMAGESWSQLRISLMDALADDDELISQTALSFHAKMFAVSNYQIMRETYTCLAEHLFKHFQSYSNANDSLPALDVNKPTTIRVLKRIRLLNEFQCEVPSIWVRFPESFLEVILNSTFALLTVHLKPEKNKTNRQLSALHYLSVIDTQANWFRRWLHGNYSRAAMLNRLANDYRSFLVEAVSRCLAFSEDFTGTGRGPHEHASPAAKQKRIYSAQQLKYTCFVHSISIVSRLLLYSGGRQLFPLRIGSSDNDVVTIPQLLVSWVKLLILAQIKPRAGNKLQEPAIFVGKAFCDLCCSNAFVESCVDASVVTSLLQPVQSWLDTNSNSSRSNTAAMLHISEVLACLTSTSSGRKLLLYEKLSDKRSAGHVIADFAQRALGGNLSIGALGKSSVPSYPVVGAFVFVCRQLYNTCDGLLLLLPYDLPRRIAAAWKQTSGSKQHSHNPLSAERDVLDFDQQSLLTQSSSRNLVTWEENLLDNLLNFAATPKGLLLLQQTGAINECVAYMQSRYTKKLQVSKCEKFGYGVMVTQIASTGAGMAALQQAGFLRAIVREFWASLECSDDMYVSAPRSYPLSPVERSVHKSLVALTNVMSSYLAVHEIFKGKPLPNKSSYSFRDMPDTPVDLFDRLVVLNSDPKIHALFNFEQSHSYGLRLLTVLSCNLDTWLLLETQYNIQQLLLDMQKNNRAYEGGIIIDQQSIERNHVLVRTHVIGADGERVLPTRTLTDMDPAGNVSSRTPTKTKEPFVWPLFYQLPIPKDYIPQVSAQFSMKKESSLSRFLTKTKLNDKNRHWLDQLRSAFVKALVSSPSAIRGGVVVDILEKAIAAQERMPEERVFKKTSGQGQVKRDSPSSSPIVAAGVKLVVRYGKHLNIIKSNVEAAANNLLNVIQVTSQHLQQQQTYSPSLKMISGPYPCHDWFASTLFLMLSGNKDRTVTLLQKMSEVLVSGYLWPARLHASVHLSNEMRMSGIPPLYSCTAHHVELILQVRLLVVAQVTCKYNVRMIDQQFSTVYENDVNKLQGKAIAELPLVHSAFRMSGYTPSQITLHWLTQCFWNYLPWLEITHYVVTVVVMGSDFQVYFCVSILKHLQQLILMHRQTQDLQLFLKENPVVGFVTGEWIEYMQHLQHKYQETVLPSMRNILH